jgi:hypothetical protein
MESWSRGFVAVVGGLCLLSGCSPTTTIESESIAQVSASIARADRITFFEGLPHPMYESKSLDSERKSKPTIERYGFSFYREALKLKPGDEARFKSLLGSPGSFEPFKGEKKCGGFHADYFVEWSGVKELSSCLICFTCGEVKIYGPLYGLGRYDIQSDALKLLKDLLQPYRKNRPPQEGLP